MRRNYRACQFRRARRQAQDRRVTHKHPKNLTAPCIVSYTSPKGVRRMTKLKLNHYLKEYTYGRCYKPMH